MSNKLLAAHLHVAKRNMHSAELLIDAEPEDAAFLAQQAAEKLLKGVLIRKGIETAAVRNKHSLAELGRLLPTAYRFEQDFSDLVWLEDFATT